MANRASLAERIAPLTSGFRSSDLDIAVQVIALVAYADLEVDDREMDAIHEAMEAVYSMKLARDIIRGFVSDAKAEIRAAGGILFATQIGKNLRARGLAEPGLRLGFAIADSSEGISAVERERLLALAEGAKLDGNAIEAAERAATGGS